MKANKSNKISEKKEALQLMIQGNIQEYIQLIYGITTPKKLVS
jgi:hypothetical protein